MKKGPRCRVCQEEHWGREAHVWKGEVAEPRELCRPRASNAASNLASASNRSASNGGDGVVEASPAVNREAGVRFSASPQKQRWDREAYNAYQRELMRARRAKGKVDATT